MNRDRKRKVMDRSFMALEKIERAFYDKINVGKSSFNYSKMKECTSINHLIETPLNYLNQEV